MLAAEALSVIGDLMGPEMGKRFQSRLLVPSTAFHMIFSLVVGNNVYCWGRPSASRPRSTRTQNPLQAHDGRELVARNLLVNVILMISLVDVRLLGSVTASRIQVIIRVEVRETNGQESEFRLCQLVFREL